MVLTRDAVEADEAANVRTIELDETLIVSGGVAGAKSCRLGANKQADLGDFCRVVVDDGARELTWLPVQGHRGAIESILGRLWANITHRNGA